MTPDSPTPPNDEDLASNVFAETRASTLIPKTPPTSGSETLVPTPENSEPDEPQGADEIVITTATTEAPAKTEAPELSGEFVAEPALAEPALTEPAPAEPALAEPALAEPALTESTPAAPQPQPADNPALALTFAPAPDAPFQSSVTVGIRCDAPDAQIYYTLDGTAPDQNSTAYDKDKILLTQSATLSARAFAADQSGAIQGADYIVSKPMWQENEPADQTDVVAHKESENQTAPDNWQLAAASVRGKLHAHRALWREDSFALGNIGQWSVIAVSDGAGSAPLSRIGSRLACDKSLESLSQSLGQLDELSADQQTLATNDLPPLRAALVGAAADALAALQAEAQTRSQPLAAFAATLLILVRRAWNDRQICAAIQVGDGAIALDCASGLKLLGEADHGQHSSETRFLTTRGIEAELAGRVKFSLPDDLRATLVISDGVSDDYFPEDKRLTEVFEAVTPLAQNADDAGAALLEWLGYEKKGSSDDRTIALSWMGAGLDAKTDSQVEDGETGLTPPSNREDSSETQSEDNAAGLTPPSNLEDSPETRLEEGVSPAPTTLVSEQETSTSAASDEIPTETRDGV